MTENPAAHLSKSDRDALVRGLRPETEFQRVLQCLIDRMPSVQWVEVTHGPAENGKDLIFASNDDIDGVSHTAVVVKVGKISGGQGGSRNLREVKDQVEQAITRDWPSARLKRRVSMDRIIVATTDSISSKAQEDIVALRQGRLHRVSFWPGSKVSDLIYKHHPEFFSKLSPSMEQYLDSLISEQDKVTGHLSRLAGLASRKVQDLYVEPGIAVIDVKQLRVTGARRSLGVTGLALRHDKSDFQFAGTDVIERAPKSTVLLGPPGSGKSTVMKKAAVNLAVRVSTGDTDAPLPFFVSAVELLAHLKENTVATLFAAMPLCKSIGSVEYLEQVVSEQPTMVFIDALDEIPRGDDRSKVENFIGELDSAYKKMTVIASARWSFFERATKLTGFRHAMILPMHTGAIKQLLDKVLGKSEASIRILNALLDNDLHKRLPRTPLVYAALAVLHEAQELDEIPSSLTDLYDMVLQVYLGRWSAGALGQSGPALYELKRRILEQIAYTMQANRDFRIESTVARTIIVDYLDSRRIAMDPDDLLTAILDSTDLIYREVDCSIGDQATEYFVFSHHSFQEYFAARVLDASDMSSNELAELFMDPWWSNAVTFVAGDKKDVKELIRGVVQQGPPDNGLLSLAVAQQFGWLLQAATHTDGRTRKRGVRHGADLVQYFYNTYALLLKEKEAPVKMGQLQMSALAVTMFALSYGSQGLAQITEDALQETLLEFTNADGDKRDLLGLQCLCMAMAMAERGNWSGANLFLEEVQTTDLPLVQTLGEFVELMAGNAGTEDGPKRWATTLRALRKLAPTGGMKAVLALANRKPRVTQTPALTQSGSGAQSPETNVNPKP